MGDSIDSEVCDVKDLSASEYIVVCCIFGDAHLNNNRQVKTYCPRVNRRHYDLPQSMPYHGAQRQHIVKAAN